MSNLVELKENGQKVFNEAFAKQQDVGTNLAFNQGRVTGLEAQITDKKAELVKLNADKKAAKEAVVKGKTELTAAKAEFKEVAASVKGLGITEFVPLEEETDEAEGTNENEFME